MPSIDRPGIVIHFLLLGPSYLMCLLPVRAQSRVSQDAFSRIILEWEASLTVNSIFIVFLVAC
jgi:hypothetical protein